jgi:shikimate kinase
LSPSSRITPIGDRNIVLIGFMGTGKSAVGRILAERLGRRFFDTDSIIEKRAGKQVRAIFAEEGESCFREMESEVIRDLAARRGCVIASGGGAVLSGENVRALKSNGMLICLQADPEFLCRRLARSDDRPLLPKGRAERLSRIKELLHARRAHYAVADLSVDVSRKPSGQVAREILELIDAVPRPG